MELVWKCDAETIIGRVKAFYESTDHAAMVPFAEACMATKQLSRSHDLMIVTSRPDSTQPHVHAIVKKHFPRTFERIHFTNGYAAAKDARIRKKSEVCKEIGAAVLIDDALIHAQEVAAAGIPVLLPDRPWNRDHTPKGVTRVHGWDEIVSWIDAHLPCLELSS